MSNAGLHILEALVFASATFAIALVCVWILFSGLRRVIFSYLDELDAQAAKVKRDNKGVPADQRSAYELSRALTCVALAIVSASKAILAGLIVLAMAQAVVG